MPSSVLPTIASSDDFDDVGQIQPGFPIASLLGDVVVYLGDQRRLADRVVTQRLVADNDDFLAVAPAMPQFAGPFIPREQFLVHIVECPGKFGTQQLM